MAILNRITLKNFFRKGSVPTETNFADLIDSSINIVEDGIGRSIDDGFRIAPMGYSKKLLSFYENSQKVKPDWFISLNEGNSKGLSFHESDNDTRLVLKGGGNIGIGISNPTSKLEVKGCIGMDARKGTFKIGQVPGDANYGGFLNQLQFRWKGEVNNYALQVRTRRHYGLNDQNAEPYAIRFNVTQLWSDAE